jgi:hypothetical protein
VTKFYPSILSKKLGFNFTDKPSKPIFGNFKFFSKSFVGKFRPTPSYKIGHLGSMVFLGVMVLGSGTGGFFIWGRLNESVRPQFMNRTCKYNRIMNMAFKYVPFILNVGFAVILIIICIFSINFCTSLIQDTNLCKNVIRSKRRLIIRNRCYDLKNISAKNLDKLQLSKDNDIRVKKNANF